MDRAPRLSDYMDIIDLDEPAELHSGQFHDVVVTARAAFRFPRTRSASLALAERAQVLTRLSRLDLGFAVPVPLELTGDYLCTTVVPGARLANDADGRIVGAELARALAAIAAATPHLRDLVPDTDPWQPFAAGVVADLYPLMSEAGRERARAELDAVLALPVAGPPVLVHTDLGGDNLRWGPGPRLVGVLDWDGLRLGDPANDVASIAATYGWPVATLAARRDEALLARARVIRETFALQQALPAARSGDKANLADGLADYA